MTGSEKWLNIKSTTEKACLGISMRDDRPSRRHALEVTSREWGQRWRRLCTPGFVLAFRDGEEIGVGGVQLGRKINYFLIVICDETTHSRILDQNGRLEMGQKLP